MSPTYERSSRGSPTFLNPDRPYPDQIFTAVIWGENRSKFTPPPEVQFRDKRICVTGRIDSYRGVPQIVVTEPRQIVVEEDQD